MKKVSTAVAKQSRNIWAQKLTIGLDLGDRNSWYCVLDESGESRELESRTASRTGTAAERNRVAERAHRGIQPAHREPGTAELSAGGAAEADQGSGYIESR